MIPRLVLKRGFAKPIWHGHPWVFAQAVLRWEGDVVDGSIIDIVDDAKRFVGRGVAEPDSAIAARILTRVEEEIDGAFFRRRLEQAKALRQGLGLPSERTDAYRWINGEGDAVPGLIVDVYGDSCRFHVTVSGLRAFVSEITGHLVELGRFRTVYEANAVPAGASRHARRDPVRMAHGEAQDNLRFVEHGLAFTADPHVGQKTGAFLDQRENHVRVARYCVGASVLDCFTYLGGFALHALQAGAERVTAVDISARALERARAHATVAGFASRATFVESDVFSYLERAPAESFDVVILDPPKFAPSRRELAAAQKGYQKLNRLGIQATRRGGFLVTASCSQRMTPELFERTLAEAAHLAQRELTVLETHRLPPDHPVPVGFQEGQYLKLNICRVR